MFYIKRTEEVCAKKAEALAPTFYHKCYICERKEGIDQLEIEHRIPLSADKSDKSLLEGWNLFCACSRCNGAGCKGENYFEKSSICKHGHGYLGIIDCTKCDPNHVIDLSIDVDENVTVSKKKTTPCIELTMKLLTKVYGIGVLTRNNGLAKLISEIIEEITTIEKVIRRLKNYVRESYADDLIEECKDELILLMHPRRPFFAIKLSNLQTIYDKTANDSKMKSVLCGILNHDSLHPRSSPACCRESDKH
jgi:hypothetical protein